MRRRLAGLLAATWLLAACGGGAPALSPLAPGDRILAFGDSITHGTGAPPGQSYPEVLAALSGREVVRAGVPGELSAAGRERLPGVLARHQPALVILCHGGNDLLRRQSAEAAARNLEAMIARAREAGAEVVLLGVPKPGLLLRAAGFYRAIAEREGVVYEGEALADVLSDAALKADPVHPNAKGYRVLAERLHALLRERGAL